MNKLIKTLKWTFWSITAAVVALAIFAVSLTPTPETTPEQLAEERQRHVALSTITSHVKNNLRNPDSFDIRQLLILSDGTICLTYAGENGFGGTSVETIAFSHPQIVPYETHCRGKSGTDWTLFSRVNYG